MRIAAAALIAFACSGAFASDPGQPLDCSDWVGDLPGYSCEMVDGYTTLGTNLAIDNQGFVLYVLNDDSCTNCGVRLFRSDPGSPLSSPIMVGHIQQRLEPRPGTDATDRINTTPGCEVDYSGAVHCATTFTVASSRVLWFDATSGSVFIPVKVGCFGSPCDYGQVPHLLRIRGFATIFEVLQSFSPATSVLSYRVPYMPEGMAAADHFDTYWGPLAHPIDFTQAHPLQCGYPTAPPHVGDYLTVADTVPTPSPGQGVYYVTSATYQGATRYGRKTTAGHLSGRDPAVLPACTP